jgi:hypothetical protein
MESYNDPFKTSVLVLKGSVNYHRWATAIRQALVARDLWDVVCMKPMLKSDLSEQQLIAIRTATARSQRLSPNRESSETPHPSIESSEGSRANTPATSIVNVSDIFARDQRIDRMYKPEQDEYVYHPRNNAAVGCITSLISYTL